jgi:DNA-directed RNA polymerase specialized sigma24 family protein
VLAYQRATELAEANLRALESPVINTVDKRLANEKIRLARPDLEAAYNQAWQNVYNMFTKGAPIDCLKAILVTCTRRRAIDIYRKRNDGRYTDAPLDDEHFGNFGVEKVDLIEQLHDRQTIIRLVRRLQVLLNPTERNAVALCLLRGYRRHEAADLLGIPEPAFQKIMDRASRKLATVCTQLSVRGCGDEEWAQALRSYALELICRDSPDYGRITTHIASCESCRRYTTAVSAIRRTPPTP